MTTVGSVAIVGYAGVPLAVGARIVATQAIKGAGVGLAEAAVIVGAKNTY